MKRSTMARTFILVLVYLMVFPVVAGAGWETEKTHWPRLIYEASDLPRIRARVHSGQEPYRTLWERIQGRAKNEPRHGTNDWSVEYENGNIAKDAAFVYAMTGDMAYAQRAWNALLKMKCDAKWWDSKDVNESIRMAQSLTAHCQGYDMLRGAGYCPSATHGKARENLAKLADDPYAIGKNSIYWLKTDASSGSAAAGLGNWGSPNTHRDFGWTGGQTQGVSMLSTGFTLKVDFRDALTSAESSTTKHVEYEGDEDARRVK